jgi:methanogenic corrinoid protein MtbC1
MGPERTAADNALTALAGRIGRKSGSLRTSDRLRPATNAGAAPGKGPPGRLARTIENDVIPRLAQAHRQPVSAAEAAAQTPSADEVRQFAEHLVDGSEEALEGLVERMRLRGMAVETLYAELFAPAARHLGSLWDHDLCDFTTVTAGLGRLQRLLRDLSTSFGTEVQYPMHGRRLLLAQPPQEQHSFGLSMVAEFFRRDGWMVEGGVGSAVRDPVARARAEWFDAVGFSIGSVSRLDWMRDKIAALRLASRNAAVVVLVGGPLFAVDTSLVGQVGADGYAPDARDAPALASDLVSSGVARS